MKKTIVVAAAISLGLAWSACSASATQWYNFTFSGADLMSFGGTFETNLPADSSPADIGLLDGARRYHNNDYSVDLRTYRSQGETFSYYGWTLSTRERLGQFNLWGLGDPSNATKEQKATEWGEVFIAEDWINAGSSDSIWQNVVDNNGIGDVLTWYIGEDTDPSTAQAAGDAYAHGLGFSGSYPTFTFTLGLADDFDDWYMDRVGELVFWFGGTMYTAPTTNPYSQNSGVLQGNMILSGTPVPEPATLLLFGSGLAGLMGWRRKQNR